MKPSQAVNPFCRGEPMNEHDQSEGMLQSHMVTIRWLVHEKFKSLLEKKQFVEQAEHPG